MVGRDITPDIKIVENRFPSECYYNDEHGLYADEYYTTQNSVEHHSSSNSEITNKVTEKKSEYIAVSVGDNQHFRFFRSAANGIENTGIEEINAEFIA